MGKLEREHKKRAQKANIKKVVLRTVAVAGVLSIAVLAPNVLGALSKLGVVPQKRQKETVVNTKTRLVQQGLLTRENGLLRLTPKGERVLRRLELKDYALQKPRRLDGKWRMLIFDIPERRKKSREQVRKTLATIGFVRLQDSVWLYPYDCEDLVTLLKADFHIGKDLLYLIVDSLEGDMHFKHHFGLIH